MAKKPAFGVKNPVKLLKREFVFSKTEDELF